MAARADVLVSHGIAAWQGSFLGWKGGNFSRIGVLREPNTWMQSRFRYCGGNSHPISTKECTPYRTGCCIPHIYAKNLTLQQGYEQWVTDQCKHGGGGGGKAVGCMPDEHALYYFAPPELLKRKGLKPSLMEPKVANRSAGPAAEQMKLTAADLVTVMSYIVRRYAVVGVLERPAETLEVIRCRIPWLSKAHEYPHERSTAAYPVSLSNELIRTSLNELEANTAQLYGLANLILSVDIECCRQGGAVRR